MPIQTLHVRQRLGQLKSQSSRLFEDLAKQNTLQLALIRTDKVAAAVETEESKIRANPHLTPEGRRAQLKTLADKMGKELAFLRDEVKTANTNLQTMADLLLSDEGRRQLDRAYDRPLPPIEEDRTLRYLREQEIRAEWRQKPQPERDREYSRALQAGDHEIVRALANAPGTPLVTADLKSRVDLEYAKQRFPVAFSNFTEVKTLRDELQGLELLTDKWLNDLGAQS